MDEDKGDGQHKPTFTNPQNGNYEENVEIIVNMGYLEADVKRALHASFGNPERAIEYLINGIPDSPSTPEGDTSQSNVNDLKKINPFEFLRTDREFRRLRRNAIRNPQFVNTVIKRIGSRSRFINQCLKDYREQFLNMVFEPFDNDNDIYYSIDDEDEGVESDREIDEEN